MDGNLLTRRGFIQRTAAGLCTVGLSQILMSHTALGADKTLTIAVPTNPTTFDPMNQVNHDTLAATHAIFENLMRVDQQGAVHPQLAAAAPKISEDKLTYWFDLRDDVYFHDGTKFNAEDVKYSYEYILDPKNKGARRGIWLPIREITVESPTRVRFDMRYPYRPMLHYMSKLMGVFPRGSREKYGDDHFRLKPTGVGTGPGIFEEWQQNDFVSMRRNPNYWDKGIPHWDRFVMRTVAEDSVRVAYLLTNQAQIISSPAPKEFVRLRTAEGIVGGSNAGLGPMLHMQMNTMKAPFDDVNFRKAVACAIDRKLLADKVFYGLLDPSPTVAPSTSWWYNQEAADTVSYNPEKARAYLAKSRYKSAAEFDLLVPSLAYLIDVRDAAVVVQSQLAAVGIAAKLQLMEPVQVISRNLSGNHVASFFCNMSPSDPTYLPQVFFTPDQVMSKSSNYSDPKLTDAIKESFRYDSEDRAHLKPLYGQIQAMVAEASPNAFVGFVKTANLWRKEIKNFQPNSGVTMLVRDVDF